MMELELGTLTTTKPWQRMCLSGLLVALVAGCAYQPTAKENDDDAQRELSKSLQKSAEKAAAARVEWVNMKPVDANGRSTGINPGQQSPMRDASSRVDIDFVGPVERALKIVSSSLGWSFEVAGKKRVETLVSLRHKNTDALIVLRDIGTQCGDRCDVNVSVVEGGRSRILLSFKD
jgi:hypothetical protein